MPLKLGTKQQGFALLGNTNIDKAYLGTSLVFQQGFVRTLTGIPPLTTPKATIGKDLINYKIYGNTVQGLPTEYQRVEYLTLTGTQYIDTGFKANTTTTTYQTGITTSDLNAAQGLFGSRNIAGTANTGSCNVFYLKNNLRVDWAAATASGVLNNQITADTYYEITCSRSIVSVNGQDFTYTDQTSVNQVGNFLIGSFTDGSSTAYVYGHKGRIYFGKLYSNGQLVRNFIPAVRKSDNKPGMYDLVTNTFYTNAGTGEFTVGANVYPTPTAPIEIQSVGDKDGTSYQIPIRTNGVPKEYRQVEYLGNTTTQWINTNLMVEAGDEFETCSSTSSTGSFHTVIGAPDEFELYYNLPSAVAWITASSTVSILSGKTSNIATNEVCTHRIRLTSINGGARRNLHFFAYSGNYYLQGNIYYVKWYRNGQLVRNFIPAVRKSDNKPGMYDTVTGQFYTNAGTGEFAVGATVSAITLAQPLRRIVAGSTTYADYSDYESQKVYRQVGVKVLTGTEDWALSSTNPKRFYLVLPANTYKRESFTPICTHFKGHASTTGTSGLSPNEISFYYNSATSPSQELYVYADIEVSTANDFKQWLAQQYAAGTPVTIVYPLATATEESVSLPALPTERGATTTVDVATEVVPSSVEIVYRGK